MIIVPDPSIIKLFHEELVEIFTGEEAPSEIIDGYINEGLVDACVAFSFRENLLGEPIYASFIQMASTLFHQLIISHPFVDGNKRTALCTLHYTLLWNGLYLKMPEDAAEFLIKIATLEENITFDMVYEWVMANTTGTLFSFVRSVLLIFFARLYLIWPLDILGRLTSFIGFRPYPQFIEEALKREKPKGKPRVFR